MFKYGGSLTGSMEEIICPNCGGKEWTPNAEFGCSSIKLTNEIIIKFSCNDFKCDTIINLKCKILCFVETSERGEMDLKMIDLRKKFVGVQR